MFLRGNPRPAAHSCATPPALARTVDQYAEGQEIDPYVWPLPDDTFSHPRSAGTFTRFLLQYVHERKIIGWPDAIAKASYLPAKRLEETAPRTKKKGRLQVGMDAEIIIFDPATVQDRVT
jgi:N-acyl-D-glutamate deacylase